MALQALVALQAMVAVVALLAWYHLKAKGSFELSSPPIVIYLCAQLLKPSF